MNRIINSLKEIQIGHFVPTHTLTKEPPTPTIVAVILLTASSPRASIYSRPDTHEVCFLAALIPSQERQGLELFFKLG